MSDSFSYINSDGFTVFTSHFHKKRGHCCSSACLHCPYGFTINQFGFEFVVPNDQDKFLIENIINESGLERPGNPFALQNISIIKLKKHTCGILIKQVVGNVLILKKEFKDQGIEEMFFSQT